MDKKRNTWEISGISDFRLLLHASTPMPGAAALSYPTGALPGPSSVWPASSAGARLRGDGELDRRSQVGIRPLRNGCATCRPPTYHVRQKSTCSPCGGWGRCPPDSVHCSAYTLRLRGEPLSVRHVKLHVLVSQPSCKFTRDLREAIMCIHGEAACYPGSPCNRTSTAILSGSLIHSALPDSIYHRRPSRLQHSIGQGPCNELNSNPTGAFHQD